MRKQKHIIQFLPYSNPHIGGVENVGEGIFEKWTYGKSFIFSGCLGQNLPVNNINSDIGHDEDGKNKKIFFPDFEIVDNFPVPKIWTMLFWRQWKNIGNEMKKVRESGDIYVITHTRFFLSSFLGGIFAKWYCITWIHIEHGSDYVKLGSPLKTKVAYFYDKIIGKWIIRKSDSVLCISKASEKFVRNEFGRPDSQVWLRGRDMPAVEKEKGGEKVFLFIGRLVHLKGVDILLKAYTQLESTTRLIIMGSGEEEENLIQYSQKLGIYKNVNFLGYQQESEVIRYLREKQCILVNPSYQEGMPTTVIEGLMTKNIVIASDVGGTADISDQDDLILVSPGNAEVLSERLQFAEANFELLSGKSYFQVRDKFSWEQSIRSLHDYL